jgi:hypothetical protein
MNVNDVQAAGRACPFNTKQEGLQYERYTMHPRLLGTSFPGFVPDLTETGEVQFKRFFYWKKTTLFFYRFIGLQPPSLWLANAGSNGCREERLRER